jgi:hypothetical protein
MNYDPSSFRDDETILPDDELLRLVPRRQFVPDPKSPTGRRVSSEAFCDSEDGPMSIIILSTFLSSNRRPHDLAPLAPAGDLAVASITVWKVRELGQGITRGPEADEPAHGLVFGKKNSNCRKKLAQAATVIVPIDFPLS